MHTHNQRKRALAGALAFAMASTTGLAAETDAPDKSAIADPADNPAHNQDRGDVEVSAAPGESDTATSQPPAPTYEEPGPDRSEDSLLADEMGGSEPVELQDNASSAQPQEPTTQGDAESAPAGDDSGMGASEDSMAPTPEDGQQSMPAEQTPSPASSTAKPQGGLTEEMQPAAQNPATDREMSQSLDGVSPPPTPTPTPQARDAKGMVQAQTSAAGVAYVTGGVAKHEQLAMEQNYSNYDLKLVNARQTQDAAFVSGVDVTITRAGKTLVETTTAGPWLWADVGPGSYEIEASFDGATKTQTVAVPEGGMLEPVILRWKVAAAEMQEPEVATEEGDPDPEPAPTQDTGNKTGQDMEGPSMEAETQSAVQSAEKAMQAEGESAGQDMEPAQMEAGMQAADKSAEKAMPAGDEMAKEPASSGMASSGESGDGAASQNGDAEVSAAPAESDTATMQPPAPTAEEPGPDPLLADEMQGMKPEESQDVGAANDGVSGGQTKTAPAQTPAADTGSDQENQDAAGSAGKKSEGGKEVITPTYVVPEPSPEPEASAQDGA